MEEANNYDALYFINPFLYTVPPKNRPFMKPTFTKKTLKAILAFGISTSLFYGQPVAAAGKPFKSYSLPADDPDEDKPAKKNKSKAKTFASLNNSSVKIYPDVIKREMHVVAKDNDGKEVDFFVFDTEGNLKHHYKMKPKDHNKMTGLARGKYVYRVFSGDEETATGNFEIR
jgi:hypothetical protein